MEDTLQLHEFFVEGGNAERSHALLHITEPSTPEEKQKGYFFAVCEIIGSTAEYITQLQQIIDTIEKGYYEDSEHSNAQSLEMILDQINKQSAHIVQRGIELHWMVGIVAHTEIIFSFHGRPTIMLFYKNRDGLYSSLDLVAQNPIERSSNPTVFSQIIQGKISPNDYLIITTPHVREFYDYDRLQRIITTRSAEESCRHLERAFQESRRELSFAGIIITIGRTIERRPAPAPRIPQQSRSSSESLQQLFTTEKDTVRTLTSSLTKNFQQGLERLTKRDKKASHAVSPIFENEPSLPAENSFKDPTTFPLSLRQRRAERMEKDQNSGSFVWYIFQMIIKGILIFGKGLLKFCIIILSFCGSLLRFFGNVFLVLINYHGERRTIINNWKQRVITFRDQIYHLPLLTKIFFILTMLLIGGVCGSVIYLNRQHTRAIAAQLFTSTTQTITKKKDDAESNLIWQNEDNARQDLTDAQKLFDQLPCKTTKDTAQQQTCQKLQSLLETLAIELRKTTSVQPDVLTTLDPAVVLQGLVKVNNFILGYSSTNPTLYTYNTLTKETQPLSVNGASSTGFSFGIANQENKSGYFFTTTKDLIQFNPKDKSLKKATLTFNKANAMISTIFLYNYRLYILDTSVPQIYRHESIVGGFARGTEWIKSNTEDLKDIVSFAIDSDMYALKKNGTILKFSGGTEQNFSIQNVDPALTSADSIYTYSDFTYLYVLDAQQGRIVILTKDGKLKAQMTAPELKGAHALVIEESTKTGYFVNGNKMYKVTLTI